MEDVRTVRQMLKALRQRASDNVLAQPSAPFSVGLFRTKFQALASEGGAASPSLEFEFFSKKGWFS